MKTWTRSVQTFLYIAALMLSIKVDVNHIFDFLQMNILKKKSQCYVLLQICGLLLEKYFHQKNAILLYCVTMTLQTERTFNKF